MKMKKKTSVKLFGLMAAICLLVTSASAAVDTGTIQPQYARIAFSSATLEIASSGRAQCCATVCLGNLTDTADLTMELQRSTNGILWTGLKSWNASGQGTVVLDRIYYVVHGYYYRVVATSKVYTSGTLAETAKVISKTVYY